MIDKNITPLVNSYLENGFVQTKIFDPLILDEFTLTFHEIIQMQLRKCNIEKSTSIIEDLTTLNKRSSINGKKYINWSKVI
jgi:hypothetical protein